MTRYFRCHHCGHMQKQNKRLKVNQKYCRSKACQRARMNQWEKVKQNQDLTYKENRKKAKSTWYKNKLGYDYQKVYRAQHPSYENWNKYKQQQRYQVALSKRANTLKVQVIKTDSTKNSNDKTEGNYKLLFNSKDLMQKIVKTDALIVEIQSA